MGAVTPGGGALRAMEDGQDASPDVDGSVPMSLINLGGDTWALFPWLAGHPERCTDPRGEAYLRRSMDRLAETLGSATAEEAAARFRQLVDSMALPAPAAKAEDLPVLCRGVKPVRRKNFPARLEAEDIEGLYREILRQDPD